MRKKISIVWIFLWTLYILIIPVYASQSFDIELESRDGEQRKGYYITPSGELVVDVTYIALQLYANEKNKIVKQLGVDTMIASTIKTQENKEYTPIGVYKKDPMLLICTNSLIPKDPFGFIDMGEEVMITIPSIQDEKIIEENVHNIIRLYEIARYLKEMTSKMSDNHKARYILKFICDNAEYDFKNENYGAALMLTDGKGNCQSYTSLFYILGRYCGLEVLIVPGKLRDNMMQNHVWNQVNLNGRWFFVDLTSYDITKDESYFLRPLEEQNEKYMIYYGGFDELLKLYMGE